DVRLGRQFFGQVGHSMRLFNLNTKAGIDYRPGTFGGHAVLFRAAGSVPKRGEDPTVADLERYARGGVEVIHVPGRHMSIILDPADVATLAEKLREVLSRAHKRATEETGTRAPDINREGPEQ
ncbi:MAG: hypothetical protein AAGF49_05295, partial [Pseudomonadota bacterium]